MKFNEIRYSAMLNLPSFAYTIKQDGCFEFSGGRFCLKEELQKCQLKEEQIIKVEVLLDKYDFPNLSDYPTCRDRDIHPVWITIEDSSGQIKEFKNVFSRYQFEFNPELLYNKIKPLLYTDLEMMNFGDEMFDLNIHLVATEKNKKAILKSCMFFFELEKILGIHNFLDVEKMKQHPLWNGS